MLEINKEEQKRFFDIGYQEGTTDPTTRFYSALRASKEHYKQYLGGLCRGKSVLEYGCGMDSSARFFCDHGAKFSAIDISEVAVELSQQQAREHGLKDVEFRVADAEHTGFPDASFDIVCGWGILHHLALHKALPELRRILKPEGQAVFIEPLGHNPAINLFRKLTPKLRTQDEHPLTWSELEMMKAYFQETEYTFYHLFTLLGVPLRGLPAYPSIVRTLGSLDRELFDHVPSTRPLAWQVLMIMKNPRQAS